MDPNAIQMSFTPTSGKYDDIEGAYWFEDGAKNKYVLLDSGASVHVTVNADFDGPSMDNRYQDESWKPTFSNSSNGRRDERCFKCSIR